MAASCQSGSLFFVLGGEGKFVEIDESAFVRRKHNVGRTVKTQWVFGGFEVGSTNIFMVAVENRSAETLMLILKKYILPGTTIVSDFWRAYLRIGQHGYHHLTVNHKLNFVDPQTLATTNHIEATWNSAKRRNRSDCGTARTQLDSYLIGFMWSFKFSNDPFGNLLEHIREVLELPRY